MNVSNDCFNLIIHFVRLWLVVSTCLFMSMWCDITDQFVLNVFANNLPASTLGATPSGQLILKLI